MTMRNAPITSPFAVSEQPLQLEPVVPDPFIAGLTLAPEAAPGPRRGPVPHP